MTSENDLEALISSTLTAIDSKTREQNPVIPEFGIEPNAQGNPACTETDDTVDKLLSDIKIVTPQVSNPSSNAAGEDADIGKLLEDFLTPDSIVESMESLAFELDIFLRGREVQDEDTKRYQSQLAIYREVSEEYKLDPNILEADSEKGERIRARIADLQQLGSPPAEVVQKLMLNQLPGNEEAEDFDIGKEFEKFVQESGSGGLLSGLTKDDEEMIKHLSQDPNALKNLLGSGSGKPGECSLM